ncbi:MAG TPA: SPASM domain-containing protein, partial [Kofleriaceae bacterium]|nr:SPASM domain-containing protein [Kofleriaceae bacterium]
FWKRYGLRVSASIDGDRATHDRQRPMVNGRGSYEATRRGLELLARAGLLEHVYWVVTPERARGGAHAVWQEIQRMGVREVGLLPERSEGPDEALPRRLGRGPAPPSFAQFLLELRAARRSAPEPWVAIREIDAAERAVAGEMPGFCELLGNCIGHVFAVDPDGTIQHCDRFLGDADYVVGDVARGGFAGARSSEALARLRARERVRLERLRACPQFARCQGWCPHVTYAGQPWLAGTDDGCCGLRPLLDGIEARVDDANGPH